MSKGNDACFRMYNREVDARKKAEAELAEMKEQHSEMLEVLDELVIGIKAMEERTGTPQLGQVVAKARALVTAVERGSE